MLGVKRVVARSKAGTTYALAPRTPSLPARAAGSASGVALSTKTRFRRPLVAQTSIRHVAQPSGAKPAARPKRACKWQFREPSVAGHRVARLGLSRRRSRAGVPGEAARHVCLPRGLSLWAGRPPLHVFSCAGQRLGAGLSRVVSRTGPEGAWLSRMREVSKIAGAVRSLGGSNPSPSADNPNRQQRRGNKQERGGPQARLSHRLKPLRPAIDCRATVAHHRRDPSKGEG